MTNSYKLQKLVKKKRLMNWFVKRAAKKEAIRDMMSEMIASKETQPVVWSPWFLAKTLLLP